MLTSSVRINGEKFSFAGTGKFGGLTAFRSAKSPAEGVTSLSFRLRNGGKAPGGSVTRVRSLDTVFPISNAVFESLNGDSCGEKSFLPYSRKIISGEPLHLEPMGGRSSNTSAFPYFIISGDGGAYAFAIGWTGQWSADISAEPDGVRVEIGLPSCDFSLKPGEEVLLPSVLVVEGEHGSNDLHALRCRLREVTRRFYSPAVRLGEGFALPSSLQCFDRYFRRDPDWATEAGQLRCADAAHALGCDTLWLDAAWFRDGFPTGVGNYCFEQGFPRGLRPVADRVHELGMRFMVWFEPERVDKRSDTAKNHPEFLLSQPNGGDNLLFNLADPAAHAWLLKTLGDFIESNGIDCYRQDFNTECLPYWQAADAPGRRGITELKYIEGLYSLWDGLISRFPKLFIDNCSSGGRRIDFETCRRSVPMWRSDTGCAPSTEKEPRAIWNQNQTLALTSCLGCHSISVWTDSAYESRSAATEGLAYDFDVFSPGFDKASAASAVAEQRRLAKYWRGRFCPLAEPSLRDDTWSGWQFDCGESGCVMLFRRPRCAEGAFRLALSGIDQAASYEVLISDERRNVSRRTLKGAELACLSVEIPAAGASAAIEYRLSV